MVLNFGDGVCTTLLPLPPFSKEEMMVVSFSDGVCTPLLPFPPFKKGSQGGFKPGSTQHQKGVLA